VKREWFRKRKHDYSATRVEGKKHLDQYRAAVPLVGAVEALIFYSSI